MATAGRAPGGFMENAYRLLMRRNSVYITFVLGGAIIGERVISQRSSPTSPPLPVISFSFFGRVLHLEYWFTRKSSGTTEAGILIDSHENPMDREDDERDPERKATRGALKEDGQSCFGILLIRSWAVSFFSDRRALHRIETLIFSRSRSSVLCSSPSATPCSCYNCTSRETYFSSDWYRLTTPLSNLDGQLSALRRAIKKSSLLPLYFSSHAIMSRN